MAVLSNGEFEIDGYVFGGSGKHPVFVESYDTGSAEWRTQDASNPSGHMRFFGRDFLDGPTWTFNFNLLGGSETEVLGHLGDLASKWRAFTKSAKPGEESVLRYNRGGRTRLVYGRPRRFSPTTRPADLRQGVAQAVAEFVTADPLYYDDDIRTLTLSSIPTTQPGFSFPLRSPFTTGRGSERQGVISDTGGDTNTPFVAVIHGPISQPYIAGDGWKLSLDISLLHDQSVTIDTRRMTVLRENGASVAGALSRASKLSNAKLRPGADEFRFGGVDNWGTSQCVVTWRPVYFAM